MNIWQVHSQSKPSGEHLLVIWMNEVGIKKEQVCKVLFENSSTYRLIAPDLKMDIQKGNCSDLIVRKIPE